MAKYKVILKGLADDTEPGWKTFRERFADAYRMELGEAKKHLEGKKGVIYNYDDPGQAESGKKFLEGLGAIAHIDVEQEVAPPDPGAAPPLEGTSDSRACPKCGYPVPASQDECPGCHIFISKYEQMMARRQEAAAAAALTPRPGYQSPTQQQPPAWPYKYLRVYNFFDMIGDTFEIYVNNFATLFLLSFLPMVPLVVLTILAVIAMVIAGLSFEQAGPVAIAVVVVLGIIIVPLIFYIQFFFTAATIIAIRDIFYNYKPQVMDTLRRTDYWIPAKLIATALLQMIIMFIAMLPVIFLFAASQSPLVIVIGILLMILVFFIMMMMFLFTMPVVVLEDIWMLDALKRSMELGKGFYIRNFAVFFAFIFTISFVMMVITLFLSMIPLFGQIAQIVLQVSITPVMTLVFIMLYFDMRARKEPQTLAGNTHPR